MLSVHSPKTADLTTQLKNAKINDENEVSKQHFYLAPINQLCKIRFLCLRCLFYNILVELGSYSLTIIVKILIISLKSF